MSQHTKQDNRRIPIGLPIVGEESLSRGGAARAEASPVSAYGQLLGERNRYVEVRHRAQQRVDQIVAAGAAGALVLSITFMRGIAPSPAAWTAVLLVAGWVALLVALGSSLAHHHLGQRAYDDYVRELDRVFGMRDLPDPKGAAARLPAAAAVALVAGLVCLAAFALLNL
jgi:hypothetical protein